MKPAVYVETSVVSYATSRLSTNLRAAGRQSVARRWFETCAQNYRLFASLLVSREAAGGDSQAAAERLKLIHGIPLLEITDSASKLASSLVQQHALPQKAVEDALHVSIAAVHGMDYLLTWNCRHIANARMRLSIARVCREHGYESPVICTPEELSDD